MGAIIRDEQGRVRAALAKYFPHVSDSTNAKTLALWQGVCLCIELDFQQVIYEGDSLRVVQVVRQSSPCLSSFGHLIDDFHFWLLRLQYSEVQHAFPEAKCGS